MPYDSIKNIPDYVKKYSEKIQRQWLYVFDSTYKKVKRETNDIKEADKRAFQAANSVLSKRFTSNKSMEKNTREDYFQYLIDSYIGNI